MSERRFQYEADVKQDPLNYDSWFDYIRLEETAGQPDRVCLWPLHALKDTSFGKAQMKEKLA